MADSQAADCCFQPSEKMMPLADAIKRLAEVVSISVGEETVALKDALGRVLSEDLVSPMNVPPHDNSAVDGYAVFHADLNPDAPTQLPVNGRIAAGHPFDRAAERGEALQIFTGAPMPEAADTVVMQEDTLEADGTVTIKPGIKKGANRRRAGEDISQGAAIIEKGQQLRPQEIGLAASVGFKELPVYKKLRIAVFSTGDEVRDPGGELPVGGIYDSNRYILMTQLQGLGCDVTDLGILPDSLENIQKALDLAAADHDVLITSGGVSLGEEDHVKAAVEALGELHFWKLAIKPGRPIALGQVKGKTFIGLPGNPVAALVTFLRIGRPVLMRLAGRAIIDAPTYKVRAGFSYSKKEGRREWLRARLSRDGEGPLALKFHSEGSGILSSMVFSDGLIELAEDVTQVDEGDLIDFLPFNEVAR